MNATLRDTLTAKYRGVNFRSLQPLVRPESMRDGKHSQPFHMVV